VPDIVCPHCREPFHPHDDECLAAALAEVNRLRENVAEEKRLGIKAECDAAMWKQSATAKQKILNEKDTDLAEAREAIRLLVKRNDDGDYYNDSVDNHPAVRKAMEEE